jgi:hypothetical protein
MTCCSTSHSSEDFSSFFLDYLPPSNSPNSSVKKSKWTPEEDELLRQNVAIRGVANWTVVSSAIPGRNGKQCRERWMNQLCPDLNKENWTAQEDFILMRQQWIYGNMWSQIAAALPGRSANAVKNRWSWLSRHHQTRPFIRPIPLPVRPIPRPLPIPQIGTMTITPIGKSDMIGDVGRDLSYGEFFMEEEKVELFQGVNPEAELESARGVQSETDFDDDDIGIRRFFEWNL